MLPLRQSTMTIVPQTRLKVSVLPSADFFTFQPLTPEDGLPVMAVVDSANTKGCVRFSGSATSTVVPVTSSATPLKVSFSPAFTRIFCVTVSVPFCTVPAPASRGC